MIELNDAKVLKIIFSACFILVDFSGCHGRPGKAGVTPAVALLDSAPPELEENEGEGEEGIRLALRIRIGRAECEVRRAATRGGRRRQCVVAGMGGVRRRRRTQERV